MRSAGAHVRWLPVYALLVGWSMAAVAAVAWARRLDDVRQAATEARVNEVLTTFEARLADAAASVREVSVYFRDPNAPISADPQLSNVPAHMARNPMVIAPFFVQPASGAEVDSILKQTETMFKLEGLALTPKTNAPRHYVVTRGALNALLGVDLGTLPGVAPTLESTARTGAVHRLPTVPPAIFEFAGVKDLPALSAYVVPTYRADPANERERSELLVGWTGLVLAPDFLVNDLQKVAGSGLAVELFEGRSLSEVTLVGMGRSDMQRGGREYVSSIGEASPLTVRLTEQPVAGSKDRSPLLVGVGGALLSLLLAGLIFFINRGRRRALEMVDEAVGDLERSERRLEELLRHSTDLVVLLDRGNLVTYASPSTFDLFGRDPAEVVGLTLVDLIGAEAAEAVESAIGLVSDVRHAQVETVDAKVQSGAKQLTLQFVVSNLLADAAIGGVVVNARDVTQQRKFEQMLIEQATYDPLTGLMNRNGLVELAGAWRDGMRVGTVAAFFCDLDGFKPINDRYGHDIGDEVLRVVAKRLLETARSGSVVVRWGGDEFVVLVSHASRSSLSGMVDRFERAISVPIDVSGLTVEVGVSVGVACCDPPDLDFDRLIRDADESMYNVKRGRRADVTL